MGRSSVGPASFVRLIVLVAPSPRVWVRPQPQALEIERKGGDGWSPPLEPEPSSQRRRSTGGASIGPTTLAFHGHEPLPGGLPVRLSPPTLQRSAADGDDGAWDGLDRRMIHSEGIERDHLCSFYPAPVDPLAFNVSAALADVLPRLEANVLAEGSFGKTRSVKWHFTAAPGDMERALRESVTAAPASRGSGADAEAEADGGAKKEAEKEAGGENEERPGSLGALLAWAGQFVALAAAADSDAFVLNALAVPCGGKVEPHYDDTLFSHRSGTKVSVLYLAVPGVAVPGVAAHVGASVDFRGDLFHGIGTMTCGGTGRGERGGGSEEGQGQGQGQGGGLGLGKERVSLVLEQYAMARFPTALVVEVDGGPQALHFPPDAPGAALEGLARRFLRAHGVDPGGGGGGGAGCGAAGDRHDDDDRQQGPRRCGAVGLLVDQMAEQQAARRNATSGCGTLRASRFS